jgi:hypothetical protein
LYLAGAGRVAGDRVLVPVSLAVGEGGAFDVDGNTLVFGRTIEAESIRAVILAYDIATGDAPRVVADLPGRFVSASLSAGGCVLVCTTSYAAASPFSNVVRVLDLETGNSRVISTRTHVSKCRHVISDFACWSPVGTAFAFSGAAFTFERDLFPRSLWIAAGVACQ